MNKHLAKIPSLVWSFVLFTGFRCTGHRSPARTNPFPSSSFALPRSDQRRRRRWPFVLSRLRWRQRWRSFDIDRPADEVDALEAVL